jgi:PAS domain S-box-containing protein
VEAVIGALAQGLVVLDRDGRGVTANAAAERILGVPRDALAEHPLVPPGWRLVRDDGRPLDSDQHPARVAQRTGTPELGEVVGLCRLDGSVLWLSVSAVPLPADDSAAPPQVVCTFSDITRQRQREQAFVAREAQILGALAMAPFALWSADGRGRLSFFAGTAAGGASRRVDLTGRPAAELFAGAPEFVDQLRRALSGESFTAFIESGGQVFETRFYPSYDASGVVEGASGISIDVTARVAAEAEQAGLRDALRRAAEEWRATFDAIESPLLVLDRDNVV